MSLISSEKINVVAVDWRAPASLLATTCEPPRALHEQLPRRDSAEDAAAILRANFVSIFCTEPQDSDLRALWHAMPVIYQEDDAGAGLDAVRRAGRAFRERFSPSEMLQMGPVTGHNGLFIMRWKAVRDGRDLATGCHLAHIRDGKIETLFTIVD